MQVMRLLASDAVSIQGCICSALCCRYGQRISHTPCVTAATPAQACVVFTHPVCGLCMLHFIACTQAQPRAYGPLGVMSGPLLAGLTCAYVDAINAGAVPTIATAWQVLLGVQLAACCTVQLHWLKCTHQQAAWWLPPHSFIVS